jgi:hypothetical protein
MSANHAAFNLIFRFVENYVSPIAGRISSQRHVMAIRDGFHLRDAVHDCGFILVSVCLPTVFARYHLGLRAPGWIWRSNLKARS